MVGAVPAFEMYLTHFDAQNALSIIGATPFGLATMDVALIDLY